jgi:hypothetical protein
LKTIVKYIVLIFLWSCSSSRVSTIWKSEPANAGKFQRILVVAILRDEDSILRKSIETRLTQSLGQMGYQAISAMDEFGTRGLSEGGEENTYLKLCNNGIDAVMTVTLVSKTENTSYAKPYSTMYPSQYYYERIWNYREMEFIRTGNYETSSSYMWESVLFDLAELKAVSAVQSHSFKGAKLHTTSERFLDQLVSSLRKQKILRKSNPVKLKAF